MPYTQSGRMMAISTPLGQDVLLLEHLAIDEGINGLFTIEAAVKSQRDDLTASDLIGATVDFRLKLKDDGTRWWNGFVTELHEGSLTSRGTRSYALTVRPKLWTLSQKSDCRIFQNTTASQIIETLCKEHGITDLDLRITQKEVSLDYSVQWNETDLQYMLRRMQQMGLFYWHDQAQGRHTFVVADHQVGYRNSSEVDVRFTEGSAAQDHISQWRRSFAFTSRRRSGRDWNFLSMSSPQGEETNLNIVPGSASDELYEFPGLFDDSMTAEQALKFRIQATETGFENVEAVSTVRTLGPGQRFTPQDVAKRSNIFAPQVVTSIRHTMADRTYETGAGRPSYENTFTVIPATTPATPHRTIQRPKIVGSQIALIAGPEGEEIFTDQYGRVKVWFPWDRRAAKDGSDTCWIRVGQPWAGSTWGHQVIPRVGMEALVSYQEGDPDRPFVTALVPDPSNPTPYPLPDNKTRMTFRSNSYKSSGFNEMTFEDATGAENMFFHAQKDHTTKIENNQTLSVGANQASVVGQNQSVTVGQNMTFEAGKSINFTIGGTGAGAASLMAPLAGMAGATAGMLGQALAIAGGGSSNTDPDNSAPPADLASVLGALASNPLAGGSAALAPVLAESLIGILSQGGQQAQANVGNGPSPRPDAGTALAEAGALFGGAVGALFGLPGIHNHITGMMKTEHVGCARIEQVGTAKVTHVGSTFGIRVGKAYGLNVGSDAIVKVGGTHSLTCTDEATTNAETITLNACSTIAGNANHDIALKSGDHMTLQATQSINVWAETIQLATEGATILMLKDKIILKAGGASVKIGDNLVKSDPLPTEGTTQGIAGVAAQSAGEIIPGKTGKWVGKGAKLLVDSLDKKGVISNAINGVFNHNGPPTQGDHGAFMPDDSGGGVYEDGTQVGPGADHSYSADVPHAPNQEPEFK